MGRGGTAGHVCRPLRRADAPERGVFWFSGAANWRNGL